VAEQARRGATAEFESLDGQAAASTEAAAASARRATAEAAAETPSAPVQATAAATSEASTDATAPEAAAATDTDEESASDLAAAATISPSRLKAVMDPTAERDETQTTSQPWEAPFAVSVAAGTGPAEEEPVPVSVGSTLLRTVRSIRPMARHDKDSGEGDASR
jgi:hypothetical protein